MSDPRYRLTMTLDVESAAHIAQAETMFSRVGFKLSRVFDRVQDKHVNRAEVMVLANDIHAEPGPPIEGPPDKQELPF